MAPGEQLEKSRYRLVSPSPRGRQVAALCWLYVSQEGLEPGGTRSSVTQIFGQAEGNMGSLVLDRLEVASHQNYSGLKLPNLVHNHLKVCHIP